MNVFAFSFGFLNKAISLGQVFFDITLTLQVISIRYEEK